MKFFKWLLVTVIVFSQGILQGMINTCTVTPTPLERVKLYLACDIKNEISSMQQCMEKPVELSQFKSQVINFFAGIQREFPGAMNWQYIFNIVQSKAVVSVDISIQGDVKQVYDSRARWFDLVRDGATVCIKLVGRPIGHEADICFVCLEKKGDLVGMTCCRQFVHSACLLRSVHAGTHYQCPVCRNPRPDFA